MKADLLQLSSQTSVSPLGWTRMSWNKEPLQLMALYPCLKGFSTSQPLQHPFCSSSNNSCSSLVWMLLRCNPRELVRIKGKRQNFKPFNVRTYQPFSLIVTLCFKVTIIRIIHTSIIFKNHILCFNFLHLLFFMILSIFVALDYLSFIILGKSDVMLCMIDLQTLKHFNFYQWS